MADMNPKTGMYYTCTIPALNVYSSVGKLTLGRLRGSVMVSMSLTYWQSFMNSGQVVNWVLKAFEQLCEDPWYEYEVTQIASSVDLSPINTFMKSIISSWYTEKINPTKLIASHVHVAIFFDMVEVLNVQSWSLILFIHIIFNEGLDLISKFGLDFGFDKVLG